MPTLSFIPASDAARRGRLRAFAGAAVCGVLALGLLCLGSWLWVARPGLLVLIGTCAVSGLFGAWACFVALRPARIRHGEDSRRLALLSEAIAAAPFPFAVYDREDVLVAWNRGYETLNRIAFAQLPKPIRYADLVCESNRHRVPPDRMAAFVDERVRLQRLGDGQPHDRLYPGGRWIRVTKKLTPSGGVVGLAADITELKVREGELAASEARFRALTESAPVGIWQIDAAGRALYANPAMRALLGLGLGTTEIPPPSEVLSLEGSLQSWSAEAPGEGERLEAILAGRDGQHHDVLVTSSRSFTSDEGLATRLLTVVDISQLKRAERAIRRIAHHDVLTGLANRMSFASTLAEAMRSAAIGGHRLTLLALDLDHFKAVNDTYGHAMGDALLQAVARRLEDVVRGGSDTIYRLGGDEFAVILTDASEAAVRGVAIRLVEELRRPFVIDDVALTIGVSIGAATCPEGGQPLDLLQRHADLALYRAKHGGRSGWEVYAAPPGERAEEQRAA